MKRSDFCLLSSMKHVFAVLTAVVISAWFIAPAIADGEQEGESKPIYITFQVPGNQGFQNMFVNRNLTVTGTYIGPFLDRGLLCVIHAGRSRQSNPRRA